MEIVPFLFVFFGIITLISHGIRVVLAGFFRLFRAEPQSDIVHE
jgi:hypothetical protein